jgi:hypothetical protein
MRARFTWATGRPQHTIYFKTRPSPWEVKQEATTNIAPSFGAIRPGRGLKHIYSCFKKPVVKCIWLGTCAHGAWATGRKNMRFLEGTKRKNIRCPFSGRGGPVGVHTFQGSVALEKVEQTRVAHYGL